MSEYRYESPNQLKMYLLDISEEMLILKLSI